MQPKQESSSLFEHLPIGAYRVSVEGHVLQVNQAFLALHRLNTMAHLQDMLQGQPLNPYANPLRRRDFAQEMQRHGRVSDFVSEIVRLSDGKRVWVREHAHALTDAQGQVLQYEGTMEDITLERKARSALRKSEAMLRNVLLTIPDQIWVKDLEGVYVTCNDAFAAALGMEPQDVIGTRDAHWVDEHVAHGFLLSDQWALQAGRTVIFEENATTHINPEGALFEVSKTPMRDAQGKTIGVLGISRNIQARKDAETLLRDTTEQLELAIMGADLGRWDHDLSIDAGYRMDARACLMLGRPVSETDMGRVWSQFVHPDDIAHVALALRSHLQGRSDAYQTEYRAQHRDGSWIWLSSRGKVVQIRKDGTPLRMVGTLMDITNRKRAEEDLRATQAELQATLDALPDLLFEFSAQGHYRAVHSQNTAMLPRAPEMLLGRTIAEVLPREAAAACMSALHEAAHEGRSDGMQYSLELPAGKLWFELSVVRKPTVGDEELRFIAIARDITERKQAEEAIRHLAFHDTLTGLPNRRMLMDRLQMALGHCQRSLEHGALMFLDLDRFKELNDTRGHDMGDLLLQEVARRLQHGIRAVDTVARLGGDEFVVLIQNLGTDPDGARLHASMVGSKILASLNETYLLKDTAHTTTPSIGVTLFAGAPTTSSEVLKKADLAMYCAKQRGRNNVCFYDEIPPLAPAKSA